MPLPIAHDTALRWTRFAWVAVVAAAVIAIGAPLLPSPTVEAPSLAPPQLPAGGESASAEGQPQQVEVVWTELEGALGAIHSVERPEQAAGDETEGEQTAEQQDIAQTPEAGEQQGLPGWRYVGDVAMGDAVIAVLSVGGAQFFIAQGEEIQGFTIDAIEPDHVIAQGHNGRFRIPRERGPEAMLRGAARGMQVRPQPDDAARIREERLRQMEGDRR